MVLVPVQVVEEEAPVAVEEAGLLVQAQALAVVEAVEEVQRLVPVEVEVVVEVAGVHIQQAFL